MNKLLIPFVVLAALASCSTRKTEIPTETKLQAVEFGDSTKMRLCKQGLMALAAGDAETFTANLADSAVFIWNSGDSVAGKAAIAAYWKDRRTNVLDKLEIYDDTWLSLRVNQARGVYPGDYVLLWARVNASYKGGKSMTQMIHNIYHFDGNGKIDRITQFLDRVPIVAAMAPTK